MPKSLGGGFTLVKFSILKVRYLPRDRYLGLLCNQQKEKHVSPKGDPPHHCRGDNTGHGELLTGDTTLPPLIRGILELELGTAEVTQDKSYPHMLHTIAAWWDWSGWFACFLRIWTLQPGQKLLELCYRGQTAPFKIFLPSLHIIRIMEHSQVLLGKDFF